VKYELTVALDTLTDETPQEFSAEVAERRWLVVVNGEVVRPRAQLVDRHQSFTSQLQLLSKTLTVPNDDVS